MNGLFGLHFQVTVHVGRKSGKEPTHKLKEETMDQSCLLAYLQAHALLDFFTHPGTTHLGNGATYSGLSLSVSMNNREAPP